MDELGENAGATVLISTGAEEDGSPIVMLSGELDSSNIDQLREAVASILALRPKRMIFDLGQLRFMDSAGISVLVGIAAELEAVQIRDPTPIVRRLIEVTGLSGVLTVAP
jgi:anti-anti-sigma factor